jgi:hypothetical protein
LIGVESEIVQCAPANRVRVLVLSDRFRVPSYRIGRLSDNPGGAAIALVVKRSIICPAGFLRRCMEFDVTYVNSSSQRNTKGLDSAIEVLVIQGIFIMPDSWTWVTHFVTHEPDAVVTGIRLVLAYRRTRSRPYANCRLRPHGRCNR